MPTPMQSITDTILGLFFPDRCAGCGKVGHLLCAACCATFQPYDPRGSVYLAPPPGQPRVLNQVTVAFRFEGAIRDAIHCLKYQRVRRLALPLASLLARHLQLCAIPADALVPVPLHPRRLAERGFNQSTLLAEHLAEASGIPLLRTGLVRSRDTPHQVGLDAQARIQNVHNAFAWQSPTRPPARVLLVDDVLTTGATLTACAVALRRAGASQVHALVLARSQATQAS